MGGEDGIDQFVIPAVAGLEPCRLGGAGGGDGDRLRLAEIEAVFEEQRNIRKEAPRPLFSRFFPQGKTFLPHTRVQDTFKQLAFALVGKDLFAEFRTVDLPGPRIEDAFAELPGDFRNDFRGVEQQLHRLIAIEDHDVRDEFPEEADGGGFPGGDTAGEREGEHGLTFNFQFSTIKEDEGETKKERGLPAGGNGINPPGVIIIVKISLVLFLIFWLGFGAWLLIRFEKLFGYHPDDPAETPGARSLNQTQVWSCWFGIFAVAGYFLFS